MKPLQTLVKLIEKRSDLSKLSTATEPSIVKFIENQSEHLSKFYIILKNVLQGDLDVLVNRAEFIIFMQSRVPLGPGKFHLVGLVWVEMFKIFAVFYRGEKLFFIWSITYQA